MTESQRAYEQGVRDGEEKAKKRIEAKNRRYFRALLKPRVSFTWEELTKRGYKPSADEKKRRSILLKLYKDSNYSMQVYPVLYTVSRRTTITNKERLNIRADRDWIETVKTHVRYK